ncbi:hypothetical protein HPB48_008508 [Haemaphysalis longicornis]|uniref:Endonuclease/exonuclease/phosphatase domain-containing protein n=1 Tax=Haemaphysalis longicornis TaxID=44386 RepID=A0A9J6GJ00_HAELO|nr:hypothetical protein HPB48_008508 [Haemaphysalis longicornis]
MALYPSCNRGSGHDWGDEAKAATVIQWNCRSLRRKKANLILCLGLNQQNSPAVIALQEVNGPIAKLPGYEGYGPANDPKGRALTAVYVRRTIVHTQLDTDSWCSPNTNVTGCRVQLSPQRTVLVFSVYIKPENSRTKLENPLPDTSFVAHFQKLYPQDLVLVCGDFNSKHTAWNYATCSRRGRKVMEDADHLGLSLLNLPHVYTRIGQTSRQADTTPDLTWTSRPQLCTWKVLEDPMGSDHLPIVVTIKTGSKKSGRGAQVKRHCCVTHWDRYTDILNTLPMTANVSELTQAMTEAKRKATKALSVPEDHRIWTGT